MRHRTKRKEEVEIRNQGDTLVYTVEKSLKEYGDKISAEDKTKIENSIADLKKALESANIDAIKKATEDLNTASHKLSEAIYQQAAQKMHSQAHLNNQVHHNLIPQIVKLNKKNQMKM